MNPVAVIFPVLGLYVHVPSDSNPRLPPSTSPPAVKIRALFSLVDSLSVIVTVDASVARFTVVPAIVSAKDVPFTVIASASSVPSMSASPDTS